MLKDKTYPYPVWAFSAYIVDPVTGAFEASETWEYRLGSHEGEIWAYARYDQYNGQSAPEAGYALAVAMYRVDVPKDVDTPHDLAERMDAIEWVTDWKDPSVTLIKQNKYNELRLAYDPTENKEQN